LKPRYSHRWDVDYAEAVRIQGRLLGRLDLTTRMRRPPRRIAGADCSYDKARSLAMAAVVVLGPDGSPREQVTSIVPCDFPYIPGLLTFREGPALLAAFEQIRKPDLIIFDGQGIAHPRGLGLAAHMGVLLDVPSVGCAKSRLCGDHGPLGRAKGSTAPLLLDGREVGVLLRTRDGVKPVYVSPGQYVSVEDSARAVLDLASGYRLPEPTRLAHRAVTLLRKEAIRG